MSISKIRENARAALAGKWGKGVSIVLAYFVFAFAVGFVIGLCGEESIIGNLLDLAFSIIQVPILFGLSYAFIKLKRDEEVNAFDFISLGFANFGRAWKIGLRQVLKLLLPLSVLMMAMAILFVGIIPFIAYSLVEVLGITGLETELNIIFDAMPELSMIIIVGLILVVVADIWYIARSLLYSLAVYVAYDNPNMSSLEVVNESARMMKGNRWKIFLLSLSFIGWAILAVFTLGIGYLWLMPYMVVAEVCFYEYLLGKNENNSSEENAEAITEM